MRKKWVLLQVLAVLIAVFQYGTRAPQQDEGGQSDRILSSIFHPYVIARIPVAGSSINHWLVITGRMNRARIRAHPRRDRRYRKMSLRMVLSQLIGMLHTCGSRTARAVWCYCSNIVYLYQLTVKSMLLYTLMECSGLVKEMLLMLSGDIEINPGPTTQLNPGDLGGLKVLLQAVGVYGRHMSAYLIHHLLACLLFSLSLEYTAVTSSNTRLKKQINTVNRMTYWKSSPRPNTHHCRLGVRCVSPGPGLGVPSGLRRMLAGVVLLLLILSGDIEVNPGPLSSEDLPEITEYLIDLEKTDVYNLGLELGLSKRKVKAKKDSETFLVDVIAAWLRKEDQVFKRREPSWTILVRALKHHRVGQNEIASNIAKDKGLHDAIISGAAIQSSPNVYSPSGSQDVTDGSGVGIASHSPRRPSLIQRLVHRRPQVESELAVEPSYYARLYYCSSGINSWEVYFAIMWNLELHIAAINAKYAEANARMGPYQEVMFKEENITLDIPGEGITLKNGWTITPLTYPRITKRQVDQFVLGRRVPSCQLHVKWTGQQEQPVELLHTVELLGAEEPSNFCSIRLPSVPSPLTPQSGVTGSAPSKPQLKDLLGALYNKVADKWKPIGVYLQISREELAGIAEKCRDDPRRCLIEMLETWLERIHPPASWATIIEAVEFLGEEQLGRELRDKYMQVTTSPTPPVTIQLPQSGVTGSAPSKPQLKDLLGALYFKVADRWKLIGVYLEISSEKLAGIAEKCRDDPRRCLIEMLETWLERIHPPASWATIMEAVEFLGEEQLGRELRDKYMQATTSPTPPVTIQVPQSMEDPSNERHPSPSQTSEQLSHVKSRHLFNEAMKHGYVMTRNTAVVFLGAAGSGKTCSKQVLMNELPPKERNSTSIAERPVKVYKMLTDKDFKWHKLSPAKQKEILAGIMRNRGEMKLAEKPMPTTDSSTSSLPRPEISLPQPLPKPESSLPNLETSLETIVNDPMATLSIAEEALIDELFTPSITEEEFVTLIDELSGTSAEPLTEVDVVYITDSGGQPQFHEVLPIFLGHASVCIFITKLSERLDAQPLVEYYDNGNPISKPQVAAQTNQQILKHCVRTMRSHRSEGKPPKIIFIGTFKDLEHTCSETRAAKNEKLLEMLLPHFNDEVIYSKLGPTDELIFALNAKEPGEDEWELAERIREHIMTKCSPERNEIPLRWYALDLALQALGKEVVSKGECFAEACKLHFDAESFEAALQYLDKLNIIFYHPKTLPSVVFTNRQVLLNKVTELVKESFHLRDKDSKVIPRMNDSRRFRDHALVTVEFLKSFDSHYEGNLFTPHDLVKLFRELLIFADFTNTNQYFMPCLLQILSCQEVANYRSSIATVPLVLHFPDGGPRLGMFCSLTVFLLSAANQFPSPWKLVVNRFNTPECLHRNCIKFKIEGYPCSITLIDTFTFFEVHVACKDDICSRLYFLIRRAVFAGLLKAASTLGYNNSHPEVAFLCSCQTEDVHLTIKEGNYWICTRDPERQTYLSPGTKHKMWITTSEPLTAGDKTPISTTQASSTDTVEELSKSDLSEISVYLDGMENSRILNLGIVLGLDFGRLRNNMRSETFLLDTLYAWLQKEDDVVKKGIPTWRALVDGLSSKGVGQTGIAAEIAKDKGIE